MSEPSEQEQRMREKMGRRLENIEKREQRFQEQRAAAEQFRSLFRAWASATECSQRTFDRVKKEVGRLADEAYQGKIEHVEERFQHAVELAVAQTLPKKRITYLKLSQALRELVDLNTAWLQAAKRSKVEQDEMLHELRILLLEMEAGQTEHMITRFQQVAASLTPVPVLAEGNSEQEKDEA